MWRAASHLFRGRRRCSARSKPGLLQLSWVGPQEVAGSSRTGAAGTLGRLDETAESRVNNLRTSEVGPQIRINRNELAASEVRVMPAPERRRCLEGPIAGISSRDSADGSWDCLSKPAIPYPGCIAGEGPLGDHDSRKASKAFPTFTSEQVYGRVKAGETERTARCTSPPSAVPMRVASQSSKRAPRSGHRERGAGVLPRAPVICR
jgi:hypothetical protein